MKTHPLLSTLALFCIVSTSAHAEGKKKKSHRPLPPEIIAEFDQDKNGKLNKEERQKARKARHAKRIEKFDADQDGKLNEEERQEARKAHRQMILEKFDKNEDGKLSKEEKKETREAGLLKRKHAKRRKDGNQKP